MAVKWESCGNMIINIWRSVCKPSCVNPTVPAKAIRSRMVCPRVTNAPLYSGDLIMSSLTWNKKTGSLLVIGPVIFHEFTLTND